MNILFLFCQVLIATQSQKVVEKEVETNKKMNIGETEKRANIIKMKQELVEKDSGRKYQEIENQMYMAQGKSKTMQISIGTSSYLLMIAIKKIL